MSDEISAAQVREMIDEDQDLVGSVEIMDDSESEFNFLIDMYNKNHVLHVAKEDHLDFIRIVAVLPIPPDLLSTLIDMRRERTELHMHLMHVLTNTPGYFDYKDENREPTTFENMKEIQLFDLIYPEELDRPRLMSGVTNIAGSVAFVRNAFLTFEENTQSQT